MEWLAEAEEAESGEGASEEETEPGELEELLPQEGEEAATEEEAASPEGEEGVLAEATPEAENAETFPESEGEQSEESTANPEGDAEQDIDESQVQDEGATSNSGDMEGLENAVLDDAFSSGEAEEEPAEPPTFAPMTADNLESLSVPES